MFLGVLVEYGASACSRMSDDGPEIGIHLLSCITRNRAANCLFHNHPTPVGDYGFEKILRQNGIFAVYDSSQPVDVHGAFANQNGFALEF